MRIWPLRIPAAIQVLVLSPVVNGDRFGMLEQIHRTARGLLPLRRVLIGLLVCGAAGAAVGLFAFAGDEGDSILMPGIILILWAVMGLIFVDIFAHLQPPPRGNPTRCRSRWFGGLRQGLHWALVLGFAALGLTVIDLSLHLSNAWLLSGLR